MKSVRYLVIFSIIFAFLCIGTYLAFAPYAIIPFASAVLIMLLPIVLAVVLIRKIKVELRLFGIGAVTFIVSQTLLVPFTAWTLTPLLVSLGVSTSPEPGSTQLLLFGVIMGLSAGVFEETARYIVYSRWLDKARQWKDALMFGAGFGGTEAFVLGVFALLNFLQAITIRNGDMSQLSPQDFGAAQAFSELYWRQEWYYYLLPILKITSIILLQLSASVLVLQAFTRKSIGWFFAAIILQSVFGAVNYFATLTYGEITADIALFAVALASFGFVFQLRAPNSDEFIEENHND